MDTTFVLWMLGSTAFLVVLQIAIDSSGFQGFAYRLRPTGLHIWYLSILPGRFIPYESIVEARRASVGEALLGVRYGLLLRRGVRLTLDRGWWRTVVITPRDPDAFLRELRGRLPARLWL